MRQGPHDTQLQNAFASYEFVVSKTQLFNILNERTLQVHLVHQDSKGAAYELGSGVIPLNKVFSAQNKQGKTPSAQVRVYEDFIDIRDKNGQCVANLRSIIYLEDNGVSKGANKPGRQIRPQTASNQPPMGLDSKIDHQTVWQLEMWKRAEEAKFKAYLKQKEIEKIEEITASWKHKETEREQQFSDSLKSLEMLETKMRQ